MLPGLTASCCIPPVQQNSHAHIVHEGSCHDADVEQVVAGKPQIEGSRLPPLWHTEGIDRSSQLRRMDAVGGQVQNAGGERLILAQMLCKAVLEACVSTHRGQPHQVDSSHAHVEQEVRPHFRVSTVQPQRMHGRSNAPQPKTRKQRRPEGPELLCLEEGQQCHAGGEEACSTGHSSGLWCPKLLSLLATARGGGDNSPSPTVLNR